jgi:acyl-CoA dehydrogenase
MGAIGRSKRLAGHDVGVKSMKLNADQIEFQDLIRKFLADKVTSDYLRRRIESGVSLDPALLKAVDELGVFDSFSGQSPTYSTIELALLAEECGRVLMPEPVLEKIVTEKFLENLLQSSDPGLFQQLIQGRAGAMLAFNQCCALQIDGNSKTVSGEIAWATGGETSDILVAFADTNDGRRALIAPLDSQEVAIRRKATSLDLTAALTSIKLKSAPATVLSLAGTRNFESLIEIIKAAEISGMCQRVMEMTVEYVKTRTQFGVPIGSFQAIQQKLAQIYAESEALNSLVRFAAWSFYNSPEQRDLTSRAAVLKAADLGVALCETAIQCHGGIGFTWEYDLHLFLRRAKMIQAAFGMTGERAGELIGMCSSKC